MNASVTEGKYGFFWSWFGFFNIEKYVLTLMVNGIGNGGQQLQIWSIIEGLQYQCPKDSPPNPANSHQSPSLQIIICVGYSVFLQRSMSSYIQSPFDEKLSEP